MAVSPLLWDDESVIWDAENVIWTTGGAPAPPCPDDLFGVAAPLMLSYLAPYWSCSTYMRAILQAVGYEIDTLNAYTDGVVASSTVDTMPDWAIPMWEATLGETSDDTWTDDDRRRRIAACLAEVRTAAGIAEYLASSLRMDAADFTVTFASNELNVDVAAALTAANIAVLEEQLDRITPVGSDYNLTDL